MMDSAGRICVIKPVTEEKLNASFWMVSFNVCATRGTLELVAISASRAGR